MNLSELVEKIARSFNLSELRELCVRLDIEYENLSGQNRNDKVIALVNYCKRHRRLEELVSHCDKLRPKESWPFNKSWYSIDLLLEPSPNGKNSQLNRRFWMIGLVVTVFLIIGSIVVLPSLFETAHDGGDADASPISTSTHTPTIDSTETPTPEIESDAGTIVFSSKRGGNGDYYNLYLMKVDGSFEPTQLTNSFANDDHPTWSPDGTQIAFVSDQDGNSEIYILNIDSSDLVRLTNNDAQDRSPQWSPDGSQIVFQSDRGGNLDIYTMKIDGSDPIPLTDDPAIDRHPSWSPDGNQIVFISRRDGNLEIYTMNADGSNETRLTQTNTSENYPFWSPDGSQFLYYSVEEESNNFDIYVLDVNSSIPMRLTDISDSDEWYPTWSPDGTKIVFLSTRDGNQEIYTMNADGTGEATRLTNNSADDDTPQWKP